jgi:hypothetical protein
MDVDAGKRPYPAPPKGALAHERGGWQSSSEMVKFVASTEARLRAGWSNVAPLRGHAPSALTV